MRARENKTVAGYAPPTIVVLGLVHELTRGLPGGSAPDALAINHMTVSGVVVTGTPHSHP
ncbi:MAG: hypothetical protein QOE13_750 [Gaiellaceae bacterium]|jgi:hypothetical protein|nr:hypothetical protein [Gaiellaceae bacterium]